MGLVIAPRPQQCDTTAKTSECQRAGHKPGGAGGIPPRLFASGLSLEKAWIPRPGPGGKPTPQVLTCAGPHPEHLPGAARYYVPFGWPGLSPTLGRSAPLPRLPGGGPHFSREMGRKRAGAPPLDPGF